MTFVSTSNLDYVCTNRGVKEYTTRRSVNTLLYAKTSKSAQKRHPKDCKKLANGHCRFLNDCAYNHQEKLIKSDDYNIIEKVKQMEKVTQALTRKVLSLEKELEEIKKNAGGGKGLKFFKDIEEK